MSAGDWILLSAGFWLIVLPLLVVAVLMLALLWERVSHEPVENVLLTPAERRAEGRMIPADAVEAVLWEAERICQRTGLLESEWALPPVKHPLEQWGGRR